MKACCFILLDLPEETYEVGSRVHHRDIHLDPYFL